MKKTLMRTITIISFLLILFSNTSIANATTLEKTDNDYYVETIITNVDSDLNFIALHSNSHTITKTKTANIKNANGTILWSVSITATFIYDGSTSLVLQMPLLILLNGKYNPFHLIKVEIPPQHLLQLIMLH